MLKIAWTEKYVLPLPPNHRFPMSKYELLPEQLLHEGTISSDNIFHPGRAPEKWILKTHTSEYWRKLTTLSLSAQEIRRTGFPLSDKLIEREVVIMNGTIMCAHFALQHGVAMNI